MTTPAAELSDETAQRYAFRAWTASAAVRELHTDVTDGGERCIGGDSNAAVAARLLHQGAVSVQLAAKLLDGSALDRQRRVAIELTL